MDLYYLRLPNGRRKKFSLYMNGHPLEDARVTAVNVSYSKKELDFETAKIELYKVIAEYRRKAKADTSKYADANLDILAKAKKDYEEREIRERSRSMGIAGLQRCVDLLGDKVLQSISLEDLKTLVNKQKPVSRPKLAVFFNLLLSHTKREDRLPVPAQPDPEVKYLTHAEFIKVLQHVSEVHRLPIVVAFVTGCRLGEIFALARYGRKASVYVERQMLPKQPWYGPTKNEKKRWAPVMEWGRDRVKEWIAQIAEMDESALQEFRNLPWYDIVRDACKAEFPKKPQKQLNFRDLRHCYAIYWLDLGASLRNVAQSMENSESVVKKHYSGFVQTDEAEELMLALEQPVAKKK